MNIGFIGLGTMGGSMALNAIRGGHDLVVHDIRRDSATPHLEMGAGWADTPREGLYYLRDGWALGHRFVTQGSSDNHFGQPGVHYNSVTGLCENELTREAVWRGLQEGCCYATTGERILLEFSANGRFMGTEFNAAVGEEISFHVEVF